MRKKEDKENFTPTDDIIKNLLNVNYKEKKGDFIMRNDENGSFESINTPLYGDEVDVDDL